MSRVTGKPPTWRRPITRTYDYNMSLGENYYKPQLDYISSRKSRGKTPPSASTFAERLVHFTPSRRSASASRREDDFSSEYRGTATSGASSIGAGESSSMSGRYASLDDLGLNDDFTRRRRQLLLDSSQETLDRGVSPQIGTKNRVTFGDKVLDAIGVKEMGGSFQSSAKASAMQRQISEEDAFDKILAERRNRRQAAIQSADADLFTEDPLKSPGMSSRLQQARSELDAMRDEMRVKESDSNSGTSRFRQRLRAKREREAREEHNDQFFGGSMSSLNEAGSLSGSKSPAVSKARQFLADMDSESMSSSSAAISKSSGRSVSAQQLKVTKVVSNSNSSAQKTLFDDDDSDITATLNKVEQIRQRAKARLAQISDEDFPDLTIGSSLASRRAAGRQQLDEEDDFGSFRLQSSGASSGGRSLAVSKRAVKASYDDYE